MISFVWSSKYPFIAGSGGSESYTAGQIRELQRRGIPCRLITIGHGTNDGRDDYPDIDFLALDSKEELSELDDTLVFVTYPLNVPTRRQSYVILHCPPSSCGGEDPLFDMKGLRGKRLIAPSKFAAKLWARTVKTSPFAFGTAYPFAEPVFGTVKRPAKTNGLPRILFAGRLTPDKGIYTLLAALQMRCGGDEPLSVTVTTAGGHTDEGAIIQKLLEAHPQITVVPARKSPRAMAELMAEHDVVVMPSTNIFWQEIFGIVSVEAQHAGCRVVASKAGGLPETNSGGLLLAKPDDPLDLARKLTKAVKMGPLSQAERERARQRFTVKASVDSLLHIIRKDEERARRAELLRKGVTLPNPYRLLPRLTTADSLKPDTYLRPRRVNS